MLGVLYTLYLLIAAWLRPEWAPLAQEGGAAEEAESQSPLMIALVRDLLGPVVLIVAVLGSIMAGIATPTEAAAIGAAGAMLLALFLKQLNLHALREVCRSTSKTSAMILFVVIGATCFSVVFKRLGGADMIEEMITGTGLGPYGLLLLLMGLIFLLGFFLEWIEISFVVLPLLLPVVAGLEFEGLSGSALMVWFAILVAINLQTSFLTPPFGYALFYLKGITQGNVGIGTIYKSIIPFVLLQLAGLVLCILFPSIVLWLPGLSG
jgi:tripartite ATP-independent transporter DctM subunit